MKKNIKNEMDETENLFVTFDYAGSRYCDWDIYQYFIILLIDLINEIRVNNDQESNTQFLELRAEVKNK